MAIETQIEKLENIVKTLDDEKDIEKAMDLFCMAVKIALIERIQKERK